jgi:hypothetical protein
VRKLDPVIKDRDGMFAKGHPKAEPSARPEDLSLERRLIKEIEPILKRAVLKNLV